MNIIDPDVGKADDAQVESLARLGGNEGAAWQPTKWGSDVRNDGGLSAQISTYAPGYGRRSHLLFEHVVTASVSHSATDVLSASPLLCAEREQPRSRWCSATCTRDRNGWCVTARRSQIRSGMEIMSLCQQRGDRLWRWISIEANARMISKSCFAPNGSFDNGGTATVAHGVTPPRGPQASRTLRGNAPGRVTSFAMYRRVALQDDQPATI